MDPDRRLLPRRARADEAARLVHVPRIRGERAALARRLREARAPPLPALRRRSREGADLAGLRLLPPRLQPPRSPRHLRDRAAAARAALESAETRTGRAGAGV